MVRFVKNRTCRTSVLTSSFHDCIVSPQEDDKMNNESHSTLVISSASNLSLRSKTEQTSTGAVVYFHPQRSCDPESTYEAVLVS